MGALSGRGGRLLDDLLLLLCIGRRTESDRAANGIRSGGERNPIGRRTRTVSKVEKSQQIRIASTKLS